MFKQPLTAALVRSSIGSWRLFLFLLVTFAAGVSAQTGPVVTGTFVAVPDMWEGRVEHTATLLQDGSVLVAGGFVQSYQTYSAERYDPASNTFVPTGNMGIPRYGHTATLLNDGTVLIAGGFGGAGGTAAFTSAEIYDPATGSFSPTGDLVKGRNFHRATLLADGKVLLTGGQGTYYQGYAEVFDPLTGTFSATGDMVVPRDFHTSTLLEDGTVLIAGGYGNDSNSVLAHRQLAAAEIFDPTTGAFHLVGEMATRRFAPAATRLADGRVLIAGGETEDPSGYAIVSSAEIYDPTTATFSPTSPMATARSLFSATLLPTGHVLVAGGKGVPCCYVTAAELYSPDTATFQSVGPLNLGRSEYTATLLDDGHVLVTGGDNFGPQHSAELFALGPHSQDATLDVVEDTPANGTLGATNPGGSPLTFSLVSNGALGTAAVTDAATGAFTYTPNLNVHGADSFTFKANDGFTDSNVATITVTISPVEDPADLLVTAVGTASSAVIPGGTLSVTDTTRNQGDAAADASITRFYLSADAVKGVDDRLLTGSRAVAGLEAGLDSGGITTVTVPGATSLGAYWLLACADDTAVVAEGVETNNCMVTATQMQVARPDLIVTTVTNPPGAAAPGSAFSVTDGTQNVGLGPASASTTRFYLSLDAIKSVSDVLLSGTRAVPILAPSATSSGSKTVTIPSTTPLGAYFLLACADDQQKVVENSDANNCLASTTGVVVARPDFVTSNVTSPAIQVAPGGKLSVTDTVTNTGAAPGAASTSRYYFSTDAVRSVDDILLTGKRSLAVLLPGGVSTAASTATVPPTTAVAAYFLLVCSDDLGKVAETDETNNCAASPATIAVRVPDLVETALTSPPLTAAAGATFSVTDTVQNQGLISSVASTTRYYLSTDPVKSVGDAPIAVTRSVGVLAPGASSTAAKTVAVPVLATGVYYLLACADDLGKVIESDETNNCLASASTVAVGP